jgi:hypothetical protein
MAKSNSDHTVKLNADFSDFVRQAKKAGEKSADLLSKAIEAGVKDSTFRAYKKSVKDYSKMRAEAEQTASALQYALAAKQANKVGAKLKKTAEEIARLTTELNDASLDDDMKKRKKAEKAFFQEKCKLLEKLNANSSETLKDDMTALRTGMAKMNRQMVISNVKMGINAKWAKVVNYQMGDGAKDFSTGVENALTKFKDGLSNIDVGAMLSGGITSAGKGMGGIAEALGSLGGMGGAIGGLASALAGVAVVLGPLIIAFGLFAGVMFSIDKEVKEFNKSAINTFGTRGVMSLGAGNMRDNLTVLRHATQDLNKTLGLTSEEAMGVFDAFDAGGISLNRLTQGAVTAAQKEKALGNVLRETASTAKALGVGVSEFTTTLAEYSNDLATSLESVTDQFAMVSKQAGDAGFSTRRFYSLITQASAGQASLNTQLSQTGDLLIRMSKTIGDKAAAEMIGSANRAFKDMGTADRTRRVMTTGGKEMKSIVSRDAERQGRNFASDLSKQMTNPEVTRAFATAAATGVPISEAARTDMTGATLVREMESMTRQQQETLQAAFTTSTDKTVSGLGRRMADLNKVSVGKSGQLFDLTESMGHLSAGATIEANLHSVDALTGGTPLSELRGPMKMMAEQLSGMSVSELENAQAMSAASEASLRILTGIKDQPLPLDEDAARALAEDQDRRYGAHIAEGGKIVTASGAEVRDATDLLTASVESGALTKEVKDENTVLAEDSLDETMTISDVLQNEITQYLRGIYEDVGLPLLDILEGWMGTSEQKRIRHETTAYKKSLSSSTRDAMAEKRSGERTVSTLGRKTDRTPEEDAQLRQAQLTVERADAMIAAADTARKRIEGYVGEDGKDVAPDLSALADYYEYSVEGVGTYSTEEQARRAMTPEQMANESAGIGPGTFGGGEYVTKTAARHTSGYGAAHSLVEEAGSDVVRRHRLADEAGGTAAPAPVAVAPGAPTAPTAPTTAAAIESFGATDLSAFGVASAAPPTSGAPTMAGEGATEDAASAVHEPIVAATEAHTAETVTQGEATRTAIETSSSEGTKAVVRALTKDVKLGNALARSNLPDAIVAAQVKQQITALASAAGLSGEDADTAISEYMEKGTFSTKLTEAFGSGMDDATRSALSSSAASLGGFAGGTTSTGLNVAARGSHSRRRAVEDEVEAADTDVATVLPPAHDFLYRGDGVRGTITPIDTADDVMGMKGGGPIDRAMGGSGGSVTVNIYGGDERRVFDVVKRVLQQSGIGPGRVTSRA